jgi:protein-S-isoprenylcysteine O-methyltransferase Ste14
MTAHAGGEVSRIAEVLARKRVPLGFVTTIAALVLARPTWTTWQVGLLVAIAGEAIRVWAAGHLEKGREVTSSGPYRWTGHPLYVGSSVLALGVVIAARSVPIAVLAALYMGSTITAAIRTEEAFLRRTFGDAYDRYQQSGGPLTTRRFSLDRAMRNREYRAVIGVVVGFALLALKVVLPI